jgi:hypothetical protein
MPIDAIEKPLRFRLREFHRKRLQLGQQLGHAGNHQAEWLLSHLHQCEELLAKPLHVLESEHGFGFHLLGLDRPNEA